MDLKDMIIRPVKLSDAEALNSMRRQDGVRENTLGIISEPIIRSEGYLKNISSDDHILVGEINGEAIGIVGLHISKSPRMRHSANIGICVKTEYQGQGIGRKLMENVLDLADNWLMLIRVELGVIEDNKRAILLYKSLGFEVEGLKKYSIIRNGKYVNEISMARYNIPK